MSDICKEWYQNHKEQINSKKAEEILNNEGYDAFCRYVTGFDAYHCAYRYAHIHGAVERTGGWANFKHYTLKNAESDYKAFDNLEKEISRLKNTLLSLIRGFGEANDLSLTSLNHQQEKIDNLLAAIKVLKDACEKIIDHSEVESEGINKHEYGFVKIADNALNSPELEAIKGLLK